jgi:enolase
MNTCNRIKKVSAKEILDSRDNPTLEVEIVSEKGVFKASVPSGASTGKHEAIELRDGGKRMNGKGVLRAVKNINEIIGPKLVGKDACNQEEIDRILIRLDGTKNKSKLGANALCGVSLAVCRAGAFRKPLWKHIAQLAGNRKPSLPYPSFNVINGGSHAKNELDFQEFMIVPLVRPFSKSFKLGSQVYQQLKESIQEELGKSSLTIGDEGGFAPLIKKPEKALGLIFNAANRIGLQNEIKIIIDVASSQFFEAGEYRTGFGSFDSKKLVSYYSSLIEKYPIIGIEDGMAEEDWEGWKLMKQSFKKLLLIGDDLTVTNKSLVEKAVKAQCANAMIIKPNQVGTLTETLECVKAAKEAGWKLIASHRSGETLDSFIADLAVGIGADFIKSGAPFKKERLAKYERLLEIEKEIKK